MAPKLAICGVGAVSAVGWTAAQTCASFRAALTGFREAGFLHTRPRVSRLIGAPAPFKEHPRDESFLGRLVRLAGTGLAECLAGAAVGGARTALLLGIKEDYRVQRDFDSRRGDLIPAIASATGISAHASSSLFPDGHASLARCLARARELLIARTVDVCFVGGVDTYLNQPDLDRFEDLCWLKRPGISQGFIPGEAGAWLAVASVGGPIRTAPRGFVLGLATASEDPAHTALHGAYPTGRVLQQAVIDALTDAGVAEPDVAFRASDVNGEVYRTQESLLAAQRVYRTRRERLHTLMPGASAGDIGAASGCVQVILSLDRIAKGLAGGRVAVCELSSDTGLRAGIVVGAPA